MNKNSILILLIFFAIIFIASSILIQVFLNSTIWEEISKVLMTLGATVVLGGLLKFLLDDYRNAIEKQQRQKEFQKTFLQQLRTIYDEVELSRLLIESHKSAKTYGERIRQGILPAKISLYDIKRSLTDNYEGLSNDKSLRIRLSIHFMISYLQTLVQEYQEQYFKISNLQAYQEGVKRESIKKYSEYLIKYNDAKGSDDPISTLKDINNLFEEKKKNNEIPGRLLTVWKAIEDLDHLNDFINAGIKSSYYQFFIEQYEYCKRIIKSDERINVIKIAKPLFYNEKYLSDILEFDENRKKGRPTTDFDLVLKILDNELY